ncbi:MAG: ABC-type transport auxiliary lipoprotein family protein [Henriciella sp.]|nr:ABC-type transport auxiliary lipoprotein family protein [Henriciella sp.]
MRRANPIRCGILSAGLFLVSACVSVLPTPVAPESLYRPEAVSVAGPLDQSLVIREPESPQIFSGQAMISEDPTGALRLVPTVEWAGRSTRLIQLALVNSFSNSGEGAALLPETGLRAPYELAGRIRLLALQGDQAVCEISASVISVTERSLVGQTIVKASSLATTSRAEDRALALKAATEACVADLAAFAASAVEAGPAE